jgi:hypothetical protein
LGPVKRYDEGIPLGLEMPAHPLVSTLDELPVDLLTEASVQAVYEVEPDPTARVLLELSDGTPLLLEKTIGQGRVLLWTSSADQSWQTMVLSPVFPILVQQAATYLEKSATAEPLVVGQSIDIQISEGETAAAATLTYPDGTEETVAVPEDVRGGVLKLADAREAGFYTVTVGSESRTLAVNADVEESDVQVVSADAVQSTAEDVRVLTPDRNLGQAARQQRKGRELWPILIVLALVLLGVEAVVAQRRTSQRP